jgi:hypothetical protein
MPSGLNRELVRFSETMASTGEYTRRQNPEEHHHTHHRENLKCHMTLNNLQEPLLMREWAKSSMCEIWPPKLATVRYEARNTPRISGDAMRIITSVPKDRNRTYLCIYIYIYKRFGMFPFKVQLFQGCKSETEPINTKSVVQHVIRYQILLAAHYKTFLT